MTPAAALATRERTAPAATRPLARSWRTRTLPGVAALLTATLLTRLLWPGTVGAVERAAAWSGSTSWKAWFFGTLDPQAATAVGAPAAAWLSAVLVRVTGTTDLTALGTALTVLAVAVLAATVRRLAGPGAGLLAGAVLALLLHSGPTEAQLALLLATAGYCVVRSTRGGRSRWLPGAGLAAGFAVLGGGWVGLTGLVLLAGSLVLRGPRPLRRSLTHLAVLAGSAAVPVVGWSLLAPWWPGSRPSLAGVWGGPVAGVLAPVAATAVALGAAWSWRRGRTAVRAALVLVLVVLVGLGSAARTAEVGTAPVDASMTSLLTGAGTTWSAAAVGYPTTADLELASGTAVLALDPSDGTTTLAQFQSYVATGRVRYLVVTDPAVEGASAEILDWVASRDPATTVGGTTVYDLIGGL